MLRELVRRWVMIAAVILGVGIGGAATAQANDTMAEADGPILNGTVYQGTIGTTNDVDWWVFYTGATTQLDIALLGLGPDDCFGPYMNLTDADGEIIEQSDNVNRNETEHIRYTVGTGTFYVEVRPNNVSPCADPEAVYRLGVGSSPALLTSPLPPPPPASTPPVGPVPPVSDDSLKTAAKKRAAAQRKAQARKKALRKCRKRRGKARRKCLKRAGFRKRARASMSGRASRRRTVYPVGITIRHRADSPACLGCEAFYGIVRSPKPACKRGRKVQGAVTYPKSIFGGKTYEEDFGKTERQGRWERVFIAIEPLARASASVERMRLRSGAICRAARASVKYRR